MKKEKRKWNMKLLIADDIKVYIYFNVVNMYSVIWMTYHIITTLRKNKLKKL